MQKSSWKVCRSACAVNHARELFGIMPRKHSFIVLFNLFFPESASASLKCSATTSKKIPSGDAFVGLNLILPSLRVLPHAIS